MAKNMWTQKLHLYVICCRSWRLVQASKVLCGRGFEHRAIVMLKREKKGAVPKLLTQGWKHLNV